MKYYLYILLIASLVMLNACDILLAPDVPDVKIDSVVVYRGRNPSTNSYTALGITLHNVSAYACTSIELSWKLSNNDDPYPNARLFRAKTKVALSLPAGDSVEIEIPIDNQVSESPPDTMKVHELMINSLLFSNDSTWTNKSQTYVFSGQSTMVDR